MRRTLIILLFCLAACGGEANVPLPPLRGEAAAPGPNADTMVPAGPHTPTCGDFPGIEDECRWWVCNGAVCLAVQMCWRLTGEGDGVACSWWDEHTAADPDMCCPADAGLLAAQGCDSEVCCASG